MREGVRTECDGRDRTEELFCSSDRGGEEESEGSSIWGHLNPQIWQDFGAHSDWSKFEMERSDWSCSFYR